jgi:hypothetical protein
MYSFIHSFFYSSQLEHTAPFGVSVITHTIRHMVGLPWTSDRPVAEASIYAGQHNIETQETNIYAPSGIRTRDLRNRAATGIGEEDV